MRKFSLILTLFLVLVTYGLAFSSPPGAPPSSGGTSLPTQGAAESLWGVSLENETHASEHVYSGADPIPPGICNGVTILTFIDTDKPDVSNGTSTLYPCWRVYAGTPTDPVDDFVDDTSGGDHSEFSAGQEIYVLMDYPTTFDFTNSNLEGNMSTDITGNTTQKMWLHFMFDGSQWIEQSNLPGLITPANMSVDAIQGALMWGTEMTDSGSIAVADLCKVYWVSAAITKTLPAYSDSVAAGNTTTAPWIRFHIRDDSETFEIDLDASDKFNRAGTVQSAGVSITGAGAGTVIECIGTADADGSGTDGWFCHANTTLSQGS